MFHKWILYCLENKVIPLCLLVLLILGGMVVSPIGQQPSWLPSDPVPVDAIPDIGENQQIVFTQWAGNSPQDIEDQITHPLTSALLGIPGVKSIRSSSIFGMSSIYIIFDEDVEFYWSRSRILEKLNALPRGLLPFGVTPTLGPDATALGQVFWYTLEGRDSDGNPTGGWDLHELRTIQDFQVKYALNAVSGVSEVASIGGHVQEYQVEVDPDALRIYQTSLTKVMEAIQSSNRDVGAQTIELNKAEYIVRGLGYIQSIEDIETSVVSVVNSVPIRIQDVAVVTLGPGTRRGILDKGGAEVVGGVVTARFGSNPLEVIDSVKKKIDQISSGLPTKTLANGVQSQLTIVPFYDRSILIKETLGTLEEALLLELLVVVVVIVVMIGNIRASLLVSAMLPVAILMVFIAMKYGQVDANIVALSGIAIAIGTMVDLGIVLLVNILQHINERPSEESMTSTVYRATAEISPAILTSVFTTLISFLPIFMMEGAEGKLFAPLAFTKTAALLAALFIVLFIVPTLAAWMFGLPFKFSQIRQRLLGVTIVLVGVGMAFITSLETGMMMILVGVLSWFQNVGSTQRKLSLGIVIVALLWVLTRVWMPLPSWSTSLNCLFVFVLVGSALGGFYALRLYYASILRWCLRHRVAFLSLPTTLIAFALFAWFGFANLMSPISGAFNSIGIPVEQGAIWRLGRGIFPGMDDEFMPSLDEGTFLLMPTSMPHAGMAHNKEVIQQLDMLVGAIPEVDMVVGKLGRADTALDPAPISMYENIIQYKPEFYLDERGHRQRFQTSNGLFQLRSGTMMSNREMLEQGLSVDMLIPDEDGSYFRNWRDSIQSADDIWNEIVNVADIPGMTSAPKLQPIETRLVMLQTGMRASMGIKVYGSDLDTIESFGRSLEQIVKTVPTVKSESVFADRIVGKPYLLLEIDRHEIARYGLTVDDVQKHISVAVGGRQLTSTVEGRERFPVTLRYPRELRNDPEQMMRVLVTTPSGDNVPLGDLVDLEYQQGPQMIKTEDTFLVGYVLFDKSAGLSDVSVVNDVQNMIQHHIETGLLNVPNGVHFEFSGSYESQQRAAQRLQIIVPLALGLILLLLYLQFRSWSIAGMVFCGVAMSFAGGFILLWCVSQDWFLYTPFESLNLRDIFHIQLTNLSVAVWVGFVALFGIATDDGVLMGTYLEQRFAQKKPSTQTEIWDTVVTAGERRITPAIMTSATTIIALLPILTSTGRGADIMIPMAIPVFGGMVVASITYFIVPVLYSWRAEIQMTRKEGE